MNNNLIDYYLTNGRYDIRKSEDRRKHLQNKERLARFARSVFSEMFGDILQETVIITKMNKKTR